MSSGGRKNVNDAREIFYGGREIQGRRAGVAWLEGQEEG